jgi:ribosomal protein L11 methyltransferase
MTCKKMYFSAMNTFKLIFEHLDQSMEEMLAAVLSSMDAEGFEHADGCFYAFFKEDLYRSSEVAEALRPFDVKYKTEVVPAQNWNALWEQNFEPVLVNDEVGVRAHFHPPFANVKYDIEITPKMSFGTGHHATTQLMLQYMCETDFTSKAVFDFGCGTGVLAIFAALKNANRVLGTDNDEWSVNNAIENCQRNQCAQIEISAADISTLHEQFDIILANINLNILLQYSSQLKALLKPSGSLFLSGLMTSDRIQIEAHYKDAGFKLVSHKQQKEWIALLFYKD